MTVFGAVYTVIGYRLVDEPFSLAAGHHRLDLPGLPGRYGLLGRRPGKLVARLGRRGALYLAVTTTAAGCCCRCRTRWRVVLLGLVLITAGFFAGHAVASSAVSRTAKTGRAQASALYQSAYYLGSSAGGTLGAVAFHAGGWAATVALGAARGARRRVDHAVRVARGAGAGATESGAGALSSALPSVPFPSPDSL